MVAKTSEWMADVRFRTAEEGGRITTLPADMKRYAAVAKIDGIEGDWSLVLAFLDEVPKAGELIRVRCNLLAPDPIAPTLKAATVFKMYEGGRFTVEGTIVERA